MDHVNQPRIDQLKRKEELRRQGELRMIIEDSFHITDNPNFPIVKKICEEIEAKVDDSNWVDVYGNPLFE